MHVFRPKKKIKIQMGSPPSHMRWICINLVTTPPFTLGHPLAYRARIQFLVWCIFCTIAHYNPLYTSIISSFDWYSMTHLFFLYILPWYIICIIKRYESLVQNPKKTYPSTMSPSKISAQKINNNRLCAGAGRRVKRSAPQGSPGFTHWNPTSEKFGTSSSKGAPWERDMGVSLNLGKLV